MNKEHAIQPWRSNDEIRKLIIDKADSDGRIRAVLLNGSRANNKVKPDQLQDFDIVYIVTEIDSFISDHSWINIFGEKLIWQLPDGMTFGETKDDAADKTFSFSYLMLFKDGNRIDLTLFSKDKIKTDFQQDSLTIVWLDKDNIFSNLVESTDFDYLIQKPAEKEFLDTCNEFWWVSTYISKGLLRNEITYSKEILETVVRPMFMKIIEWYIGTETNFSVSFGKSGKYMKSYLPENIYNKILSTYSDANLKNNWQALFIMMEVFGQLALAVAGNLNFNYNKTEEKNVTIHLKKLYNEQQY